MTTNRMCSAPAQPCRSRRRAGREGSTSILFAVLIPVLLGVVGLALDMGNIFLAQNKLQAAVDAGALAGSLQLPYDPNMTKGIVDDAVRTMVDKNFDGAVVDAIDPGQQIRSVCVHATAEVPTLLMNLFGFASNTLRANACAGFNNLEVVFVIDNSGSMKGSPINNTKEAAVDLVDLLFPEGAHPSMKVGLVPFRGKVHIKAGVDGQPDGCRNADGSVNNGIHPDFMSMYWALPSSYRRQIPEDTCSSIPPVQELTDDKNIIVNAINRQDANGEASGTVISEGIKWGREVLTPEPPYTQGSSNKKFRKIIILLTDGDTEDGKCGGSYRATYDPNTYWTNAYYGMGDDKSHCENGGALNQAMLDEAQLAKNLGIEIFSIRFGSSDNTDVSLMKQVASSKPGTDDHYYDAPSAYDIPDIFKQIGKQLGWRLLN